MENEQDQFEALRFGSDRDIANAVRMLVGIMPGPMSSRDWTRSHEIAALIRTALGVQSFAGKQS